MIPKRKLIFFVLYALPLISFSQENSPYSRYGIGNLVPSGNILNRGMGGISAGFSDAATINFLNPATYSNLVLTTLDIGAQVDSRTIKSTASAKKYTANNAVISYLNIGFPLLNSNKKAAANKVAWGVNFGLKPVSKINYKIEKNSRISNIDSLTSLYEGSGGVNEGFIGTGIKIKDFSVGLNFGYLFGNKNYSTRLGFINDTVNYLKSNSSTQTNFGGIFFNAGVQYAVKLTGGFLRLGAYGKMQKKYNASRDVLRETFTYNSATGGTDRLDSVYTSNGQKGFIQLPSTYGLGFTFDDQKHWLFGLDFEISNWSNYRFYGLKDSVKNNSTIKAGFQYSPAKEASRKYWDFVKYRAGFYFGPDYISVGKRLSQFNITAGASLPLKLKRAFYETQYSIMNVGLEYGNRGNSTNSIRESILRINVGFSLSDVWFVRRKYQ